MSRPPSEKTQLRTAQRELRALTNELRDVRMALTAMHKAHAAMRDERDEWRARFDTLLSRWGAPVEKAAAHPGEGVS